MRQPLYISSATAISPQHTYRDASFLSPVVSSDNGKLFAIDPDYTTFISPVAIRRMSRPIKMGITAGMQCLRDAGVTIPDAIITGTARGNMTDMERFIKDMVATREGLLNPTYFIQSTYNSLNGWLSLLTKATGYNQTYVHRDHSLELALFDAQMLLYESADIKHVLVGCFDELTDEYFYVKSKRDYWKKQTPGSLSLLKHSQTPGTIAGEGAAFFTVSNDPQNAECAVLSIKMLHSFGDDELHDAVNNMLAEHGLNHSDIDVLLTGINGDSRIQTRFDNLINSFPVQTTITAYKHLCGEYDTAAGFALWLASYIFSIKQIPEAIIYRDGGLRTVKHILICNQSIFNNASLILVSAT